jgi:hypothetical protein
MDLPPRTMYCQAGFFFPSRRVKPLGPVPVNRSDLTGNRKKIMEFKFSNQQPIRLAGDLR